MHSLYRIVVGASQYALSAVKLIMEIVSVGTSSLSGSLFNYYTNNTYKPVTVCRCKIGRKVFWTMDNVLELMYLDT